MGTAHHSRAVAQLRDAESARDELRDALTAADVLLPSLGLDPVSLASDYLPPLVELGRCNPDVARRLAEILRRRAT
ncbi:hypothetical protein OG372_12855 [Streptomyces sp. NBC_01020]|uniref:hypothetical protein n=1 Tax=Streptomyces sp. NBC_01020 TaxID=2903722 RepID=UPI003868D70D|nr:hypothetical protein OG372_12855 [Streptomyces sp. NBC_01020]